MKVVIVVCGSSIRGGGGAERRFARVFSHLRKEHPVEEIYLAGNRSIVDSLRDEGMFERFSRFGVLCPDRPMSVARFNCWLMHTVAAMGNPVVHLVLMQRSLLSFYAWLMTNRLPVVQTVASSRFLRYGSVDWSLVPFAHLLFRRATFIDSLYPSFLNSHWGRVYGNKTRITPCSFTDYQRFAPSEKRHIASFSGRFISGKNPLMVVDAVDIVQRYCPDVLKGWKIVMMGDGNLRFAVESRLGTETSKCVELLGSVSNPEQVLSSSSVFLSLQNTENYPSQSLLEAMACGNAIIATDVGDTRLLVDQQCGLLIEPSPVSLSQGLIRLIMDENSRTRMGKAARAKVVTSHTVERFTEYLLALWRDAFARHGKN